MKIAGCRCAIRLFSIGAALMASSVHAQTMGQAAIDPLGSAAKAEVDRLAETALRDGRLVGLSIAIGREGRLIYAAGFGSANVETSMPATADTVYRIGSLTKQFTAVAALRMTERGKMAFDAPISRYLPDLNRVGAARIDQLLWHTSGLASFDPAVMPNAFRERASDISRAELQRFAASAPQIANAGQKFSYSNTGYILVGLALERVANRDYETLITEDVLKPAGLTRTRYDSVTAIIPSRAAGYTNENSVVANAEWNSPSRPFAAGALISTAPDLVRWNQAIYEGPLLSNRSKSIMVTPGKLSDGSAIPYGMGVRLAVSGKRLRIAHGGLIVGFSAVLAHYPAERLDIAILTNTQERGKPLVDLEGAIASALLDGLGSNNRSK